MTTWATSTHIRHPWFDQPSMKRKLSVSPVNNTSSTSGTPRSSPPPKRRKFSALESGFAQLTLNNSYNNTTDTPNHVSTSAAWPYISEFVQAPHDFLSTMDADVKVPAHDVILPSYVEEPSIPEVKMRSSSWYEPEPDRIVITDLDSSSDEDEGAELDTPSISISRPLLKRLSSHAKFTNPQIPMPSSSQALVLYRPLRCDANIDDSKSNEGIFGPTVGEVIAEDNSMDVEPW